MAVAAALACLLSAHAAFAATTDMPAPRAFDLTVPQAAPVTDPYNLSATASAKINAPVAAPGTQPPPPSTSFEEFGRNVHGYLAAGIATHGGSDLEGAVSLPLVPGKLELEVGGGTTQLGGFSPYQRGGKPGTLHVSGYYADLHMHPSDDLEISLGVSRMTVREPGLFQNW